MPRRGDALQALIDIIDNPFAGFVKHLPKVIAKKHPEAATAMELAKHLAGRVAGSSRTDNINGATAHDVMEDLRKQGWGIAPVIGLQNSGKTVFAIWLARYINNDYNYCMGIQEYQRPKDFVRLTNLGQIMRLPKGSTVLLDDVGQLTSIYNSYQQKSGQTVIDFITLCRQLGLFIIVTGQNTSAINRHLFDTLQIFFIKAPGISDEFERPAIRKPYRRAQEVYRGKSTNWIQRHIYIWSQSYEGLIEYDASKVL